MARGKPRSFNRDEVLSKAMDLFWEQGFKNTSMTKLLQQMEIQRQSFYNAFGSKEKIFFEALALYARSWVRDKTAMLDAPGNPLDNIRKVLLSSLDKAEGGEIRGCMLGNSIAEFGLGNPEISKMLKKNISELEDTFRLAFIKAIDEGFLPDRKDPRALARSLIVLGQGMSLLSKLGYGREMAADVMKTVEELLSA